MNPELNKKQNHKLTIFACLLSAISIGLLIFGFSLVSSDKVVMLQSISNLSKKFETALDNSSLYDKVASSKDIGVKANFNLTSDYANANLVVNYLENQDDKKSKLDFDLAMDGQDILELEGTLANDNVYFYVNDITPNYYHTALEYANVISSLKGNDYDKLMALLKESVTNYIDNDEIKKEKVEIIYNGKNKKVNKLSYAVTNKAIADIVTDFINALKKDKELFKNVANYMGKTTDEMESELDSFVKQLTYDKVETGFYYNVYYYGFNKIVRYELADVDNKPLLEYRVEDKETINLYDSSETVLMSLEVTKKQSQYEFSGFINDSDTGNKMPFTGNLKDDTLTIVISRDGVEVKLAITSSQDIKDNNYIYKNKIVLSAETQGTEITIGTLDVNLEYYFGQKVNVDLSNSVNISEISEEDLSVIENNIMNHPIYQFFNSLAGTMDISL